MTDVEDRLKNMLEATRALELSPQEADLYSRHLHALHENHGFTHQDGSVSTLMATTVNIDGRERLIPTVVDGRIVSPSEAVEAAVAGGIERYPSYASPEEAKSRYDKMHEYMDRDVDVHRSMEEDRARESSAEPSGLPSLMQQAERDSKTTPLRERVPVLPLRDSDFPPGQRPVPEPAPDKKYWDKA